MSKAPSLRSFPRVPQQLRIIRLDEPSAEDDINVANGFATIREWVEARPNHIMSSVTEGKFIKSASTSYYYMMGEEQWYVVDTMGEEPNRSHMIFFKEAGEFYAYFPETNGFVQTTNIVMGYETALADLHGPLSFESIVSGATTSRAYVALDDGFEIHAVFDAIDMGLNPPGEICIIIRATNEGQILEVEQERLGITQKTVMTYESFGRDEVLAGLPALPDPAVDPLADSFEDEAQKNLLYFRLLEASETTV